MYKYISMLLLLALPLKANAIDDVLIHFVSTDVNTYQCSRIAWKVDVPDICTLYAQQHTDNSMTINVNGTTIPITSLTGTIKLLFNPFRVQWNGTQIFGNTNILIPTYFSFDIFKTTWPYLCDTKVDYMAINGELITFTLPTDLNYLKFPLGKPIVYNGMLQYRDNEVDIVRAYYY